jgi:2-hydroxychromene-2-carboxylate isomerase
MNTIEFFFDLSSPWTYLAFTNVEGVVVRTGANIIYRPILVGGVFNAVNQQIYAARENPDNRRFAHSGKVLKDWAVLAGVTLTFPNPYHPAKSVHAMRMACALEEDQAALRIFAKAAFEGFIGRGENLDDPDVLVRFANEAGLDGEAIRALSVSDPIKSRLRSNTDELIARGGYGSPTLFVDRTDMYFGNDQLPLVEAALKRKTE